jgi:hypothetical protein
MEALEISFFFFAFNSLKNSIPSAKPYSLYSLKTEEGVQVALELILFRYSEVALTH